MKSQQTKMKDVNIVYVGAKGDISVGIADTEYVLDVPLLGQRNMYSSDVDYLEDLDAFRDKLVDAFSVLIDTPYVEFDFEREERNAKFEHIEECSHE